VADSTKEVIRMEKTLYYGDNLDILRRYIPDENKKGISYKYL
jgi:hypothetical protein